MKYKKELVVYISMGFGNPYGDPYHEEIVLEWAQKIAALEIKTISLADTVGLASSTQVGSLTQQLINSLPQIEIGVHLHSTVDNWKGKLDAALDAGCLRIDGALKGIGGCPMAGNDLVGNMNTELMLSYLKNIGLLSEINQEALSQSISLASEIFV